MATCKNKRVPIELRMKLHSICKVFQDIERHLQLLLVPHEITELWASASRYPDPTLDC